jgi:hypothetical protein
VPPSQHSKVAAAKMDEMTSQASCSKMDELTSQAAASTPSVQLATQEVKAEKQLTKTQSQQQIQASSSSSAVAAVNKTETAVAVDDNSSPADDTEFVCVIRTSENCFASFAPRTAAFKDILLFSSQVRSPFASSCSLILISIIHYHYHYHSYFHSPSSSLIFIISYFSSLRSSPRPRWWPTICRTLTPARVPRPP